MNTQTRQYRCFAVAALACAVAPASLLAGPINPPAGPVTSTYKTLTEVEPRIPISGPINITASGSYYLTRNIAGAAGQDVITISNNFVTLDLNGFTISGGLTGIIILPATTAGNIVIKNGTIRGSSGSGIFSTAAAFGDVAPPTTVRNIRVDEMSDAGVFLGDKSTVENVTISGANGSTSSSGISVGAASRIVNSSVDSVALRGVNASSWAVIDGVSILSAGGEGLRAGFSSRISNTTISGAASGFHLNQYSTITASTASNTTSGNGFNLDVGGTVKDCNANNIEVDAYNIGAGGTVLDSTAGSVLGNAFVTTFGGGVTFDRCSAFNIGLNGFQITSGNVVINSTVSAIGNNSSFGGPNASGVITTGSGNRIEGNRFIACFYGVFVSASSTNNAVYRNTAINAGVGFSNNGGATNRVGTVQSAGPAVGPWDNTVQ
jgi:hypothetical protein